MVLGAEQRELLVLRPAFALGDRGLAGRVLVVGFEGLQDDLGALDDLARDTGQPRDMDAVALVGGTGDDLNRVWSSTTVLRSTSVIPGISFE